MGQARKVAGGVCTVFDALWLPGHRAEQNRAVMGFDSSSKVPRAVSSGGASVPKRWRKRAG